MAHQGKCLPQTLQIQGQCPGGGGALVSGSDGSKHLTLGGLVGCRQNPLGGMARGVGCERFGRQEEGKETQLLFSSYVC